MHLWDVGEVREVCEIRFHKASLANQTLIRARCAAGKLTSTVNICMKSWHAKAIIQTCGGKLTVSIGWTRQGTFSIPLIRLVPSSLAGLTPQFCRSKVIASKANAGGLLAATRRHCG